MSVFNACLYSVFGKYQVVVQRYYYTHPAYEGQLFPAYTLRIYVEGELLHENRLFSLVRCTEEMRWWLKERNAL